MSIITYDHSSGIASIFLRHLRTSETKQVKQIPKERILVTLHAKSLRANTLG